MNQDVIDQIFLNVSDELSKFSKCQSKKVCAIAVKDGRIIGTGVNGSAAGAMNCCDVFPDGVNEQNRAEHRAWSRLNEVHAEENLIAHAAKTNGGLDGCTVYVNLQPCEKCSLYLTRIGVKRVLYKHSYDYGDAIFSKLIFENAGVVFEQK